jgi:hypothetical protein
MPSSVTTGVSDDQAGEVQVADELNAMVPPWQEFGATGLKRSAGWVDEEFLPQLRGRKAVQVFKEMSENDPLVGALLFSIRMLLGVRRARRGSCDGADPAAGVQAGDDPV